MKGSLPSAAVAAQTTRPPLWRSSLHGLGTGIASIPLGIAISVLIARTLGPAGKGSYDLVLATAGLLGMALGLSLPSGVTYVVARGRNSIGSLVRQLPWVALLQGLAAVTILYILRRTNYSTSFLPQQMGNWIIPIVALHIFLAGLVSYWRAILVGGQRIIQANWYDLTGRASHLVLLLGAIGTLTILGREVSATTVILTSTGAVLLTSLILLQPVYRLSDDSDGASGFKEAAAYALPCYLANTVQFLNYRMDVFVVSFFAGVASVGLYTLAVSLAQLIWLVSNAAAVALFPRVAASQDADRENARRTAQATRITLCMSAASALCMGLLGSLMLPWVYGEEFRRSITPFLLLLPGIATFSMVNVLAAYIGGIGKPKLNLLVSLIALSLTVSLDLLLIPRLSIVGAALASTASYSISAVLTIWFFVRESGLHARDLVIPTSGDGDKLVSLTRSVLCRVRLRSSPS